MTGLKLAVRHEEEPQTTTPQMALSLFEELLPIGGLITEASRDIGFRRNRIFVDIADLGLVARRAVDAAYFIVSQDPNVRAHYDADLSYFKWLMNYNSNNRRHLRGVFREAQKAALEGDAASNETERWASIPLLGPVGISGGRLVFEVDQRIQKLVKDPEQSQFLSLRVSNAFTSKNARALYDRLLNFTDEGVTDWLDLETVRIWADADSKSFTEFKYLKRDVLDPAVKQINEVSNLEVKYSTNNIPGSKRIGAVRFTVTKKAQALTRQQALLGSKELYDTLRDEFGLSPANFDEIMANRELWTDEWIRQAMEFTRHNIEQGRVNKSVSGYLMRALRDNLRVPALELRMLEKQAEITADAVAKDASLNAAANAVTSSTKAAEEKLVAAVSTAVKAGLNWFDSLQTADKNASIGEFSRFQPAKLAARRAGINLSSLDEGQLRSNKILAECFGQFMYEKMRRQEAN